jgi:hypothetical protein
MLKYSNIRLKIAFTNVFLLSISFSPPNTLLLLTLYMHKRANNKKIIGPKFQWPPQKPEDIDPMLTGPTATPIYINPMEPTSLERPPQQISSRPDDPVPRPIVAPVKPPKTITSVPIEKGPPVYLQPEFNQRPISPMVFALTTAPPEPYNLRASPLTTGQSKVCTSVKGQQQANPPFPSISYVPQPYQPQQLPFKPVQPVQPPQTVTAPPQPKPALPTTANLPKPLAQPPPPPLVVQQPPPPLVAPPNSKPTLPPPQLPNVTQVLAPKQQMPIPLPKLAPAIVPARPISPLPTLSTIPVKQTFPPPAPVDLQRPSSPLPPLTSIPAKQTFPPPAPLFNLSKTLSFAVAAAAAPPPVSDPSPSGFGMAPSPAGGAAPPKGGSMAGTTAPRRGKGVLTAPVTGGRIPLCGHCNGQIRSAA